MIRTGLSRGREIFPFASLSQPRIFYRQIPTNEFGAIRRRNSSADSISSQTANRIVISPGTIAYKIVAKTATSETGL